MKIKILKYSFLLLAVLTVIQITGCASRQSADGKSGSKEGEKKTVVRILTRYSNPLNIRERYFMEKVEQFRSENPDIDLQDISVSDENSRDTKFRTSVAAGDPVEVFNFLGYAANQAYVVNGVITDLSEEIRKDPDWTADYHDYLFEPVTYRETNSEGIYGIPRDPYGICMFYNQEIFSELGLELPETWEEIEAVSPKLIKAGYIPIAFGAKDDYRGGHFLTALSMKMYGADLKDSLIAGEEPWNGERVVSLLEYIQHLNETGVFGKDNLTYNTDAELLKMENKEAAMVFGGSWNIGTLSQSPNSYQIVCKGFPYFADRPENKDMWMGGPDDFLSISSKPGDNDYEATLRVLKFFTSREYWQGLYELQKGAGTFPVEFEEDIMADHLTTQFNAHYNQASDMIGEIEQYDERPELIDIVRREIQGLWSGDTAKQAADHIQEKINNR